jgi:hypothetical protein
VTVGVKMKRMHNFLFSELYTLWICLKNTVQHHRDFLEAEIDNTALHRKSMSKLSGGKVDIVA